MAYGRLIVSSIFDQRSGWRSSDQDVRVNVIDFLLTSTPSSDVVDRFVVTCCEEYRQLMKVKCYSNFPNSLVHRQRHRLLCALLVLLPAVRKSEALIDSVCDFVMFALRDELQPSCRLQLEWILTFLLAENAQRRNSLVTEYMKPEKAVAEKSSFVCSLFSVATHLCCLLEDQVAKFDMLCSVVPHISPWGASSKFPMRMHSQAALLKLWHHSAEVGLRQRLAERFPLLQSNMDFAELSGTVAEKNSRRLLDNFFYFKFHPLLDHCFEMIFELWPRLTGISLSESVNCCHFSEVTKQSFKTSCHNTELRTCDPFVWTVKVKDGENETELCYTDVQRKVTTWRSVNPALEDFGRADAELSPAAGLSEAVVLVASLIDRPPNLGGLARTAEIFAVAEFVVPSLTVIEDASFLSVSVSAHQWLTMKQVPPHCLSAYLEEMKQSGYALVGVEQTTNSISLTDFKFPRKTLLLLGNEKFGIPTELIHQLDFCVEIPQQGIIRSLNVHVSGALLVWEYRKQRLLESASCGPKS